METESEVELTGIRRLSEEELFICTGPNESDSSADSEILRPGSKVQAVISKDEAIHLAERFYGISTNDIKEFSSYDDKNFYIRVDT